MGAPPIYRGQVGVVEKILKKGGKGPNKNDLLCIVKLEGDTFKD